MCCFDRFLSDIRYSKNAELINFCTADIFCFMVHSGCVPEFKRRYLMALVIVYH